jgi:hypothetical protein
MHFQLVMFLGVSAFLSLNTSCVPRQFNNTAGSNEFRALERESAQKFDFKLKNLDKALTKSGIAYESVVKGVTKEILKTDDSDGKVKLRQKSNLAFSFGKLDEKTCEVVRRTYADSIKEGFSGVDCSRDSNRRDFGLIDFLTPLMQATSNLSFDWEEMELGERPLTKEEIKKYEIEHEPFKFVHGKSINSNCWTTVYEVARRNATSFTVNLIFDTDADIIFKSDKYTKLRNSPGKQTPENMKDWLLKYPPSFGDILIVYDGNSILHAATFIDENLLFERVGGYVRFPYRVGELSDIFADYPKGKYDVRKVIRDFPHVKDANMPLFSEMAVDESMVIRQDIAWKDIAFEIDPKTQRAKLPSSAFKKLLQPK